jgi:ABC-type multidrug transport system fused ATPase/permease subunit
MKIPLRQYWDLLSRHIRPQRGRFLLLSFLLFGNIGLQLINPQIMRSFIDTALGGEALNSLMAPAILFISIAILQQVVAIGVTYFGENVAWTATNSLRAELAWHCLNLDMSFHNDRTPGEMIERIDGDISKMADFFSQFIIVLLGNLLLLIGILIALFREDWRAGLAFSAFAAIALVSLNKVRDLAMQHQKDLRQAEAEMFGFIEEQLTGTEDIRSSGALGFTLRELQRLQAAILSHDWKSGVKTWLISNLTGGLIALAEIMAVVAGYLLYSRDLVTIGTVYLFMNYIAMLATPLWMLTHEIQSFQTIGACVERLAELRKLETRVKDGHNGHLSPGPLALTFDQVSFSYNADGAVLSDVSFKLREGEVLGLLGRTGSGKTTLTRLIFRLYDPSQGKIFLDGSELREAKLEGLRGRVAIVTQEVQLFRASVRDNLTFFDRSISDEKILAAIEQLELGDWFRSLPKGLDTELETGGHSLSAGEAQLLAFTRVFLRDPGLVILDEASSRLDPATEQRIERAIDQLLRNRTAIIVAHRLHTVHRADEVMILDGGRIQEYGPRKALAGDPHSHFNNLLQTGLEEVLV